MRMYLFFSPHAARPVWHFIPRRTGQTGKMSANHCLCVRQSAFFLRHSLLRVCRASAYSYLLAGKALNLWPSAQQTRAESLFRFFCVRMARAQT